VADTLNAQVKLADLPASKWVTTQFRLEVVRRVVRLTHLTFFCQRAPSFRKLLSQSYPREV